MFIGLFQWHVHNFVEKISLDSISDATPRIKLLQQETTRPRLRSGVKVDD